MPKITIDEFHQNVGDHVEARTIKSALIMGHQGRGDISYTITFEDGTVLDIKAIRGADGEPALEVTATKD